MSANGERIDDALLNLGEKTNEELRELLSDLSEEELRLSYKRRVLHGKIDILRAELVRRLKGEQESGADVISGADIDRLIHILARDLRGVSDVDVAALLEGEDED